MKGLTEFLLEEVFLADQKPKKPQKEDKRAYDSFSEKEHNKRVLRLAEYLLKIGEFDTAYPFLHYNERGICGEVDLLVENKDEQAWFEIKYRFTSSGFKKAAIQYKNYLLAFPEFKGRAYYVSCDGVAIEISNPETLKQFNLQK